MRIAVVQHRLRPAPAQDLEALVLASGRAATEGADVVLLPEVIALNDGPLRDELVRRLDDEVPVPVLVPHLEADVEGGGAISDHTLGRVAVLVQDASIDKEALERAYHAQPDVLVLAPGSESELQAEAVLELAIGLSTSLAALVIIVEPDGADLGVPGHGGSAVLHLGEVLAEAMEGDDTLLVDVGVPIGRPEPSGALPEVPPLLAGRIAAHQGRKLEVGYPADLA